MSLIFAASLLAAAEIYLLGGPNLPSLRHALGVLDIPSPQVFAVVRDVGYVVKHCNGLVWDAWQMCASLICHMFGLWLVLMCTTCLGHKTVILLNLTYLCCKQ